MSSATPETARQPNRLAASTSPYLLQHADNPVDWWPWCQEALDLARRLDRPILLSIGYSACHWCHVMAHESFEDPATAELMNGLFVNIKVDREERPDLDKIYQTAHQFLVQRAGGWPLTLFLGPDDLTPFFAGTYFPRERRFGMPAFAEVLQSVERAYRDQPDLIAQQNGNLIAALSALDPETSDVLPDPALIQGAVMQLAASFDAEHGGFGRAPKFPHATSLELLLRRYAATVGQGRPDTRALQMASFTLERMIRGGLTDQVGGGICRYSVDDHWMIPHFEKMLYDNGPLLALCCDAYRATSDPLFARAAGATADWVMREMQSPEGGYYSTLDADSEGHEGLFYVWDRAEVESLLEAPEFAAMAAVHGLDRPANFEGRWHLHGYRTQDEAARLLGWTAELVEARLTSARAKLFAARERRVRPGRDEKVLTAWNGLMIKGMARAARVLECPDCLDSAERALGFVRDRLWHQGRLFATYKDGRAHLNAYLDDHANLLDAILELLQTRWSTVDLRFAIALAEVLLGQFEDAGQGGFWFTSHDHEQLIHRPKPLADESTPAGNGVAAHALQRLGHLIGETRYLDAASRTLRLASSAIERVPYGHASLLFALEELETPPEILVIRAEGARLRSLQREAQTGYHPHRMVLAIPASATDLPGTLAAMTAGAGARIYRCQGTYCEAPRDLPAES